VFDLVVTAFCALTLVVLLFAGCGTTSKEEELFDTLLLATRNVLQFGRLASVMRQCVLLRGFHDDDGRVLIPGSDARRSGHSIFSRPKPIDLRTRNLDIDLEDDDVAVENAEMGQSLLFEANAERERSARRRSMTDMPRAAQAVADRDAEDVWAELG
jgi:hypothetical protein